MGSASMVMLDVESLKNEIEEETGGWMDGLLSYTVKAMSDRTSLRPSFWAHGKGP